jgi:hypothetical protein
MVSATTFLATLYVPRFADAAHNPLAEEDALGHETDVFVGFIETAVLPVDVAMLWSVGSLFHSSDVI